MNLRSMFPDDPIPTDDTGFREFLNRNFLGTLNLFSDIKNATAKVAMKSIATTPLTLESLYAYLSAYCTALIPFSDDLLTQASDMDCQQTLIKAFNDGLPPAFRNILEETSCSTWSSLQKQFREYVTPTNVQLAMAREKEWKFRRDTKNNTTQRESNKDASNGSREGKRAASVKSAIASAKPLRNKSEIKSDTSERSKSCKSCRSDRRETMQCHLRTCYNCRDKGEHCGHLQSKCKERQRREEYIESVTQAAWKAAAAKAMQEVYLFYNDEDEDEYSYYSVDAP